MRDKGDDLGTGAGGAPLRAVGQDETVGTNHIADHTATDAADTGTDTAAGTADDSTADTATDTANDAATDSTAATADDSTDAMGPGLGDGDSVSTGPEAAHHILRGLSNTSTAARSVATAVASLVDSPVLGDLAGAAVLADDLTALARAAHVLSVEVARRAHTADVHDVTATGVRSTLVRAGWTAGEVSRSLRLGTILHRHPDLTAALRSGCLNRDAVLGIAHATRRLTADECEQVVAWLLSWAPTLDTAGIKIAAQAAVDHLHPTTADEQEQSDHDDRYLAFTRFRGMVMFEGRLPALDGEAFAAAVAAYAEKLRVEGDGLTRAQRSADGLTGIVADLTAQGRVPTRNGAPATVSVVIPIRDADRVAAGRPRCPLPLPDLTGVDTSDKLSLDRGAGVVAGAHSLGDAAARLLLCCADVSGVIVRPSPVGDLLAGTALEPLALGRSRRFASTAQRRALALRDRGCVIPGCDVAADACQTHHVTDWAHGGVTDVDEMALLCWTHHRQVDLRRWTLTRNTDATGPHWRVRRARRSSWRRRT